MDKNICSDHLGNKNTEKYAQIFNMAVKAPTLLLNYFNLINVFYILSL